MARLKPYGFNLGRDVVVFGAFLHANGQPSLLGAQYFGAPIPVGATRCGWHIVRIPTVLAHPSGPRQIRLTPGCSAHTEPYRFPLLNQRYSTTTDMVWSSCPNCGDAPLTDRMHTHHNGRNPRYPREVDQSAKKKNKKYTNWYLFYLNARKINQNLRIMRISSGPLHGLSIDMLVACSSSIN